MGVWVGTSVSVGGTGVEVGGKGVVGAAQPASKASRRMRGNNLFGFMVMPPNWTLLVGAVLRDCPELRANRADT